MPLQFIPEKSPQLVIRFGFYNTIDVFTYITKHIFTYDSEIRVLCFMDISSGSYYLVAKPKPLSILRFEMFSVLD